MSPQPAPQVSFIIPVYNCLDYIEKCLGSIAAQDFTDWEAVVVDDGSTDGSGDLCDRWALADSRIRVVHTPNGGVSAARNTGIENAAGRWIAFVDSDDSVEPDYLGTMMVHAGDADLVNCGWEQNGRRYSPPRMDVPHSDYERVFFASGFNYEYVWGKLLNRDIIMKHGIRFAEGVRWSEDVLFINEYFMHSHSAALIPDVLYHYTYRPGSGVNRIHPSANELLGFQSALKLQPMLIREFSPGVVQWFGPYAFLHRYVQAVMAEHADMAERLRCLRPLRFDRRMMHCRHGNFRERIFNHLIMHRHWRLLSMLWK